MSALVDAATIVLVGSGALMFVAGTLGLLRFPDRLSRVHALSKADNLGLGLVVAGLLPQASGGAAGLKLVLIWLLAQLSAAVASQMLGEALDREAPRA